uniref:Uncharacterized protein n=1 Tax=Geolu virus TaxID=2800917 RepID=A0A894KNB2_9VIRU|nr:MAG: hypothetical protein [Geolu virus]
MCYAYSACKITNYLAAETVVYGHPDMKVNGCDVTDQVVECDFSGSFHLEADGDGYFAVQAPPVRKSDHYNFSVSYGNFTDKFLELGTVSISIDEVNSNSSGRNRGLRPRREKPGAVTTETTNIVTREEVERKQLEQTPLDINKGSTELEVASVYDNFQRRLKELPEENEVPSEPVHQLVQDLTGLKDDSDEENDKPLKSFKIWLDNQTEYDPIEEQDFSEFPPEAPARIPSPTRTAVTTSDLPTTEQVMRMSGVYDPSDRRHVKGVLADKRLRKFGKMLLPSMGGSRSSALSGGTLRQKHSDTMRKYMTSEEQVQAMKVKNQSGTQSMLEYIASLNLHDRVPTT